MGRHGRGRRGGFLNRSVDTGRRGVPLLAAGFLGAWLTRFFRQDDSSDRPESLQDQLLIAVSSASPVALPDSPDYLVEQKSRFTIVLERSIEPSSSFANISTVVQHPQAPQASPIDEEDDDDAGILWLHRSDASSSSLSSDGRVVSESSLPESANNSVESPQVDTRPSVYDPEDITEGRIVSITELNEQMGPPAPEEEDDDEAGWLWWSDGVLAWFASATAGLLGGSGGGSGATIVDPVADVVTSGLNIGFAAGPFINGRLDLKAIDGDGNTLFFFSGQAVGESLGDGATLTGLTTETVLGESVITGLNVAFDDYSGPVSLQVDAGSAYLDEARSVGAQTADNASLELDTPLRAFADVPSGEFGSVSMSPFTELAIRLIENAKDNLNINLDTPNAADLTQAKSFYESATARVQDLVGVDIRNTNPVTVNQVSFVDNAQTSASQYGLKLAALSQLGNDLKLGVSAAIDRLFDSVDAQANDVRGEISFAKPTQSLRNQEQLTDSQDDYLEGNSAIAALVVDAIRPALAPVIDPVVVVQAGSVTINGTAFLSDTENSLGKSSDLSVRMALGDSTVFTADGVEGTGAGALSVGEPGGVAEDGTVESTDWSLRIDNLDQGVYTFDVFVVDEGANVTRSETASGDTTPQLILLDGTSGDGGATEVTLNLTEGDAADAISASTALLAVDLGSGDIVSASSFSVLATSNPLNLTDAELKDLVTLEDGTGLDDDGQGQSVALPGGKLLDGPSNLASLQWSFAGDADVFDALASGDTLTATYTLTGDDQDSNRSNEARLEVTITGTNDAPDVVVADASGNEDTPIELTRLSVADVDENADLTVVLSVADGDVSIASDVSGGLSAGDISGGGSGTVTLTGTVDEINATLSAAGSVTYQGDANFSGIDTLTLTTTDSAGASTSAQADISVADVNDAPTFTLPPTGEVQDGPLSGSGDFTLSNLSGDFSDFVTDPDAGDTLTFSVTNGAVGAFGTLSLNADGTYLYTPDVAAVEALGVGESGSDNFLIDVVDSQGSSGGSFFTVDILGANDRPSVETALSASGDENTGAISLNLLAGASDRDSSDSLSVANPIYRIDDEPTASGGSTAPNGLSLSGDTVTVNTDAAAFDDLAAGASREITVTFDVTDDSGEANRALEQTATITINGVNDAPVNTINGASTDEDASVLISGLSVTDPDTNETLTLTLAVANGTLNIQNTGLGGAEAQISDNQSAAVTLTGTAIEINGTLSELLAVTYTPPENFFGADTLTMTTTDRAGATATDTASITVTSVADTPEVNAALTTKVIEDGVDVSLNLLNGASDVEDGNSLSVTGVTYTIDGSETGNSGSDVPAGLSIAGDTLSVDADASAFQSLGVNETQEVVASYTIEDNDGGSTAQTATITIEGVNDAPALSALAAASVADGPAIGSGDFTLSNNLSGDFSQSASDADAGDTLSFTLAGSASGNFGSLSLSGDGTYQYQVNANAVDALASGESGSDAFSVVVDDGNGGTATETFVVNLTGENDTPQVVNALSAEVTEDGADVTVNLLDTASDIDASDSINISNLRFSVEGMLSSGGGTSIPAGLSLSGDDLTLEPGASVFQSLGSGDSQVITLNYDIVDDSGQPNDTVAQSLTLTINGVDDAPELDTALPTGSISEDLNATTRTTSNLTGDFSNFLSAVDSGDTVTFLLADGLASSFGAFGDLLLQDDGVYQYIVDGAGIEALAAGDSVVETFAIAVSADGLSTTETFSVNITGANDVPTLSALSAGSLTDGSGAGSGDFVVSGLSGDFSASASDVDTGDTLVFSVSGGSAGSFGDLVLSGDGSYVYNVDVAAVEELGAGESGSDSFSITVTDSQNATDTEVFLVNVVGANDRPVVTAPLTQTLAEDDSPIVVDLLSGASDRDVNDVISASNITFRVDDVLTASGGSALPAGLTVSGDSVSVDASDSVFQSLGSGDEQTILIAYDVVDNSAQGNDTVAQTATITVEGVNDAPDLTSNDITATEADVSGGFNVDADTSTLLNNATDVDHANDTLVVSGFGDDQSIQASGGETLTITLDYTNDAGNSDSGRVELTLSGDGSYVLGNLSFDNLAAGSSASGDFYYQVRDPDGAVSGLEQATLTIQSGTGESALDVDLSAGPFISTTFAVEGYAEDGTHLFTYQAGELTHSAIGVTLTDVVKDVGLRTGLTLPPQAASILNSLPGGPNSLPPGLADNGTGITHGFALRFDAYQDDVLLRVTDASGDTAAYVDEATGQAIELDTDLRGLVSLAPGGSVDVSVTPFSEAAVRLAESGGQSLDFSTLSQGQIDSVRGFYQSAAGLIDQLVGINPSSQGARPINLDLTGEPVDTQSNQHGLKLAALSQSNTSVAGGLASLLNGVAVSASGNALTVTDRAAFLNSKVELTTALNNFRDAGPSAAQPTAAGSGDFAVLDQTAPDAANVSVDTLRTNASQPTLTGTVILTDSLNEAGTPETLDFQVIVNGEVFDYADGSGDIVVNSADDTWSLDLASAGASMLAEGTYSVTAVLTDAAENATADTSVDELVVETDRPVLTLSVDPRLYRAGELANLDVAGTESVATLAINEVVFSANAFELTAINKSSGDTLKATTFAKTLANSTFEEIFIAANAVEDEAGNGNTASNTERVIVLGDDAVDGSADTDDILDDSTTLKDGTDRATNTGEFVHGDAGDDVLFGYGGNDVLLGGADDDVLLGAAGEDTFLAGAGDDYMAGGSGDDLYLLDEFGPDAGAENIFIGNEGVDQVQLQQTTGDYLINRATAAQIADFNNLLDAGDSNGNGQSEFRGLDMPDLQFNADLPVLRIDRLIDAGRQTDFVQAEELVFADTTLVFETLDDEAFLTTQNANDALIHNGGGRPVQETGDNYVLGKNAADRLIGGDGDDDLRGGAGNDVLVSLGGADQIDGGSGDDTLIAFGMGSGAPAELTGGDGNDTFVVVAQSQGAVGVTIKDFSLVDDLINLDGLLNASGDAFGSGDLAAAINTLTIDESNNALEIDLSQFFVQDPVDAESTVSASGTLRIEFLDNVDNADNNPSTQINYAADNPVEQTDWWGDLLNDGGLI